VISWKNLREIASLRLATVDILFYIWHTTISLLENLINHTSPSIFALKKYTTLLKVWSTTISLLEDLNASTIK